MERSFAKFCVLFALILNGEAHPLAEEEALRKENPRDSSGLNTESSPTAKEEFNPFGANACLHVSPNLPACDFHRNERSADNAEDPRTYTKDSFDSISDRPHSLNPKLTSRNGIKSLATDSAAVGFTVYKIEGCLPSRLPFNMPLCNELGSIGKVTDVRRLYPFTVSNPARSSYVFPEFDHDAWMRTMNGMRASRESTTDDSVDEDEGSDLMPGAIVADEHMRGSSEDPIIDPDPKQEPGINDRSAKTEEEKRRSRQKREVSLDEIVDPDGSIRREVRAISSRAWNSNPFANTIFLEPSQNLDTLDELRAWNRASEPIESEQSVRRSDFDDVNTLLERSSDRPIRQRRQSKLNNEIGQESEHRDQFVRRKVDVRRMSRDIKAGSEFPYWKAIPYDPKKLMLAGISTAVDDNRSRKTRDTLYGLARNSLKDSRGWKGKFEARKDKGGDKVGIGGRWSDEETSRTETRSLPKTYMKEQTDKVRANGPRSRTTFGKVGSSKAPAKRQKKKDSKRGRRFGR